MKFKEAIQRFDERNERGEIPSLEDEDERRALTDNQRDQAVSAAAAGLSRATGPDEGKLEEIEIDPYVETLPEHARLDAEERGLKASSAGNYAHNARVFVAGVEGKVYENQRSGSRRVLPDWKPEYAALCTYIEESDRKHLGLKAAFILLQNLALKRKIRSPEELPDRATIERWTDEDEVSGSYVRKMLRAVRYIREARDDSSLPDFQRLVRSNERGVRALPDIEERLQEAGMKRKPGDLTSKDILDAIAPEIAKGVRAYLNSVGSPSQATVTTAWGSSSRLVASAIRLGFDPSDLDHEEVFQPTIKLDEGFSERVAEKVSEEDVRKTCPMDRIIDDWAPRSFANSHLELVGNYEEKPYSYTDSLRNDLRMIATIADRAFGVEMRDTDRWGRAEAQFEDLKTKVEEHNKTRTVIGRKNKSKIVDAVLLPQLICIGLPALESEVRGHRNRYYRAVEKHQQGETEHDALHNAKTRFFKWLRRYVITAVIVDNGLRVKNYAGSVLGQNIFVEYECGEDEEGQRVPVGVGSVRTRFRGYRDPEYVRLKIRQNQNQHDRQRERVLSPGVVDHELLGNYLLQMRPYKLVQAGLLPDEEAFDPLDDEFALFVSPHSTNKHGRYDEEAVRKAFGKSLHWICREVLGRDVPDWDSEEHRTKWRELFAPHINRLLIGSYWGGIRGDWTHAVYLTDTKEETLRDNYNSAASDVIQRKYQLDGWEHPEFFDDLMDRIRAGKEIDWKAVRKERSLP